MFSGGWIETRYEDNVADLETESRRLLEYLGLPWDEIVLRFYDRACQKALIVIPVCDKFETCRFDNHPYLTAT